MDKFFAKAKANPGVICGEPGDGRVIRLALNSLKNSGLPEISPEYAEFLKNYNGMSYDGGCLYGIGPHILKNLDILEINQRLRRYDCRERIILGHDEFDWLAYHPGRGTYQLLDKEDAALLEEFTSLSQALRYIIKI